MKTPRQTGFTMIELIVVIVILGILAAVAIPRFINMSTDASNAAVAGVAGAAGSAMTLNYGGCSLTGVTGIASSAAPTNTVAKCVTIANCRDVAAILQGGLPVNYTIGSVALTPNGTTATCAVTLTSGTSTYVANFAGIGAGN